MSNQFEIERTTLCGSKIEVGQGLVRVSKVSEER